MKTNAIILVAGKSTRFDNNMSKQAFLLCNKPVYSYSINAFNNSKLINNIVVVTDQKHFDEISNFVKYMNKVNVILGGETRQLSVECGLAFFKESSNDEFVIIHDGARPLIDKKIIENTIKEVAKYEAVTTCIPLEDTIAAKDENDSLAEFVNREKLVKIQTPQAFKMGVIREAHKNAKDTFATDDCSLVRKLPHEVKLIPGSKKLAKLTTLEDVNYLETFIK